MTTPRPTRTVGGARAAAWAGAGAAAGASWRRAPEDCLAAGVGGPTATVMAMAWTMAISVVAPVEWRSGEGLGVRLSWLPPCVFYRLLSNERRRHTK
jgi:hypothetical protein